MAPSAVHSHFWPLLLTAGGVVLLSAVVAWRYSSTYTRREVEEEDRGRTTTMKTREEREEKRLSLLTEEEEVKPTASPTSSEERSHSSSGSPFPKLDSPSNSRPLPLFVDGLGLSESPRAASGSSSPTLTRFRSMSKVLSKFPKTDEKTYVFFGTQTGTAEMFAQNVGEWLKQNDVEYEVRDLEDLEPDKFIAMRYVVFVVATYGEGEPTDNAVEFAKWLGSREREYDCLLGQSFAVMGLGSRQYPMFNAMAIKTEKHLKKLGATAFCSLGLGDDDEDIEEYFENWMSQEFIPGFLSLRDAEVVARTRDSRASLQDVLSLTSEGVFVLDEARVSQTRHSSLSRRSASHISPRARTSLSMSIDFTLPDTFMWQQLRRAPLDLVLGDTTTELLAAHPNPPKVVPADIHAKFYLLCVPVSVVESRELYQVPDPRNGLTTKHIELKMSQGSTGLSQYHTGDTLCVLPENPKHLVEWFCSRLQGQWLDSSKSERRLSLDTIVHFVPRPNPDASSKVDDGKRPFPTPCTLREALTRYCDLNGLPLKSTLRDFLCFIEDPVERSAFERILQEPQAKDFKEFVKGACMNLKEIIEIFMTSAKIDVGGFLQLVARQKERAYTISSSSLVQPKQLSITVSKVQNELRPLRSVLDGLKDAGYLPRLGRDDLKARFDDLADRNRMFQGVCSSYLCECVGTSESQVKELLVHIRPSSFHLPKNLRAPILMVASGTGVAPFRAFLQEMAFLDSHSSIKRTGERMLFFGCRHSEKDWLYKNEMLKAISTSDSKDERVLDTLMCAFSRQQANKVYVQHKIWEMRETVWNLLGQSGGYLYICGSMAMGRDVLETITRIGEEVGNERAFVDCLKKESRVIEEVWSS